jgi:hypothetical protein
MGSTANALIYFTEWYKNFGEGFTKRNLWQMRKFYETYPIMHALRAQLTWTHYRLIEINWL